MSLKRYEILKKALNELGNHNDGTLFPYGRYYGAGWNWCSEFVSYIYKEAGYPFTGGSYSSRVDDPPDNGDWMLRTSEQIISWFKRHAIYIHRDSELWYTHKPEPGDFVFIGRVGTDRQHSGVIEYLGFDGTLNTIEGNNRRRNVMRFQYPHYRINKTDNGMADGIIMGIGVLEK